MCSTALVASSAAWANPQGGQVVGGAATIVQSPATPNRLTINQTSQNAILNWQSFSIGAGEQVIFQQPNASASALNRVTGGQASIIAGQLTANGQVFLVNPNGAFIMGGAQINVGGLVVSAADIANANFMAGNLLFDRPGAPAASIVNAGQISVRDGGLAAFVAPQVQNSGVIEARLGKVALASGSTFTLDLYGDNLVKLAVNPNTAAALTGARVDNSGQIKADGGTVALTVGAAQSIVDNLINVGGTIQARTASLQNGKIVLSGAGGTVTVSGTLDASGKQPGQTGGTVEVLGGAVALASGAKIDASGAAGGGKVVVGGNFHGFGPEPNASITTVAAGAGISADAITRGDGGQIVIWSDVTTSYAGSITARGGASGGNGGYVEVSGKQNLAFSGTVDLRAPYGANGTLLLDPLEVIVSDSDPNAGVDKDISGSFSGSLSGGDDAGKTDFISTSAFLTVLATSNVSIATSTGDITFDNIAGGITSASTNSLTLNAGGNLNFNAGATGITTAGSLAAIGATINVAIPITTKGGQTYMGPVAIGPATTLTDTGGGAISFSSTVSGGATGTLSVITAGQVSLGGNIAAGAVDLSGAGGVSLTAATVSIDTSAGSGSIALSPVTGNGDALALTSNASAISLTTVNNAGALSAAGGQITLSGNITAGAIDFSAASGETLGAATVTLDTHAASGPINLAPVTGASKALTLSSGTGAVSLASVAGVSTLNVSGGQTTLGGDITAGSVGFSGSGGIALGAATVTIDTSSSGGAINLAAATVTGGGNNLSLTSGTGAISLGAVSGVAALAASGATTLGSNVTTSGGQTYSGAVSLGTSLTLQDTGGSHAVIFGGTLAGGSHVLTVLDDTAPSFSGTVSQLANLVLAPNTAAQSIAVGDSGLASLASGATQYDFASGGGLRRPATSGVTKLTIGSNTAGPIALTSFAPSGALALVTANGETITLAGSVTTSGGQSYGGAVALGAAATLKDTNGGAISFASTIGSSPAGNSLTASTSGAVILGGNVTLGAVDLSAAASVTLAAATVTIDTSAAGGAITLAPVTGSGDNLTLASGAGTTTLKAVSGVDALSISGATILSGNVTTSGGQSYGGAVTLGASLTLQDTGGQNIAFASTLDADQASKHWALSLATTSGGTISFASPVGGIAPLGALAASGGAISLAADIATNAAGIDFSAATGENLSSSVTLNAGVGSISLAQVTANTSNLSLNAGTITLRGISTTGTLAYTASSLVLSGGTYTLGGSSYNFSTPASLSLGGTLILGQPTSFGATALAADTVLDSHAVNGALTLGDVTGANHALSLTAGAGTLSLNAVGSGTAVSALTVTGGVTTLNGNITSTGTVDLSAAAGEVLGAGTVTIDTHTGSGAIKLGAVTGGGGNLTLDASASGAVSAAGAVSGVTSLGLVNASSFTFSDALSAATLTTGSGSFSVALDGTTNIATAASFANTGLVTLGSGATALSFAGGVAHTGGPTTIAGTVSTAGNAIGFGSVTVSGGSTLDTGAGATITLGAVNGANPGGQALTLLAPSNAISLQGSMGGTFPLGALALTDGTLSISPNVNIATAGVFSQSGATVLLANGANPTMTTVRTTGGAPAGANIGFAGAIDGGSVGLQALQLSAGTGGTVSLGSSVGATVPLGGFQATGAAVTLNGAASTSGTTGISIAASGGSLDITSSIDNAGTGPITLSAGGDLSLGGSVGASTTGSIFLTADSHGNGSGTITFGAPVGNSLADSVSLTAASLAGNSPVDGTGTLSIKPSQSGIHVGLGDLHLVADSFYVDSATLMHFGSGFTGIAVTSNLGTIDVSNGGSLLFNSALTLTATTINLYNGIATGGRAITLSGAVTLQGDTSLDTTNAGAATTGGAISFSSLVGGNHNLSLTGGTSGGISASSNVSGIATLQIASAASATFSGSLSASALSTASQPYSVTLSGTTTIANAATFNNTGVLTLGSGGTALGFAGGIAHTGGATTIAGTVSTVGGPISFGSVTLNGGSTFDTGTGATITLGAVDGVSPGGQALTLLAPNHSISLTGSLGTTFPLGALALTDTTLLISSAADITTAGAAFTQTGATVLSGGGASTTIIDTTSGHPAGANIGFTGAIDGAGAGLQALQLIAGTSGTVSLGGSVGFTTRLGGLSANGAGVTLGGTVLTSGTTGISIVSSGGSLAIASAIDNAGTGPITLSAKNDLLLNATVGASTHGAIFLIADSAGSGTGTIDFGAAVGGTTAGSVSVTAASFAGTSVVDGTGTLSIQPSTNVDVGLGDGAVASAAPFHVGTALLMNFGGGFSGVEIVSNLGTIKVDNPVPLGFNSDLTLSGNAIDLRQGVLTSGHAITLSGAVTLGANVTLDTTAGGAASGGAIHLTGTVDADSAMNNRTLALDAGNAHTIALDGAVGSQQALAGLTIVESAGAVFGGNVTVTAGLGVLSILDTQTGAAAVLNGTLTANSLSATNGALMTNYDVTLNGATDVADMVVFNTGGIVTLGQGGTSLLFSGGVSQGSGTMRLDGSILTNGAPIALHNVILLGDAALDTTNAGVQGAGAAIQIAGTVDADAAGTLRNLTLNAGTTGSVSIGGTIGVTFPLAGLTLTQSKGALFTGQIVATQGAGTVAINDEQAGSTVVFNGGVDAAVLTAANTAHHYDVSILGATRVTSAASFANSGTLTLAAAGAVLSFPGGLVHTQGPTTLAGSIGANGAVNLADVTLTGATTLDSTNGGNSSGAPVTLTSVSGAGASLTLNGGTSGAISVSGATTVGTLELVNARGAEFGATVQAGPIQIDNASGDIAFDGAVSASSFSTASRGYSVTFKSTTSVAGAGIFLNSGGVTLGSGGTNLSFGGGFTSTASGTILAGTLRTSGQPISIGTLTLQGDGTLDTTGGGGGGAGGIMLSNVSGNGMLILNAGAGGTITVSGAVSSSGVHIASANTATFSGPVTASQVIIDNASDAVTFNGALTATTLTTQAQPYSVVLNGATEVTGPALFLNQGGLTLGADATTVLNFTGGITATAAKTILAGSVHTSGQAATFGALTLAGDGLIDTGAGGAITLGAVTGAGHALKLTAGSGAVVLADVGAASPVKGLTVTGGAVKLGGNIISTGAVDLSATAGETLSAPKVLIDTTNGGQAPGAAISLAAVSGNASLTLVSGSGAVTLASVGLNAPVGGLVISGGDVSIAGNIVSTGAIDLSDTSALALPGGAVTIDSTGGGQGPGAAILLPGVTGTGVNLTLNAGGASLAMAGPASLGSLEIVDAATANFAAALSAGTIKLDNGGSIVFADAVTATNLVTGAQPYSLTFAGATAVSAPVTFANSGTLTLGSGGTALAFSGGLTHKAGPTVLDGTVTSAGQPITLGSVLLAGPAALDTTNGGAAAGADIALGAIDAIGGRQSLTLDAGTATIALNGALGAVVPLGALNFTDGMLVIAPNVDITTAGAPFSQTGATMFTAGNGAPASSNIDTTGGGVVSGGAITFSAAIDDSAPGAVALALNAGASPVEISGAVGGTAQQGLSAQSTASASNSIAILSNSLGLTPVFGGATPFASFSVAGSQVKLDDAVTTTGAQNYQASTLTLGGLLYQTAGAPITVSGALVLNKDTVTLDTTAGGVAAAGAVVGLKTANGPAMVLVVDPGTDGSLSLTGGSLRKIYVLEGTGSTLSNMTLGNATLGGSGQGVGDVIAGGSGKDAAARAFILPKGKWSINASAVSLLDPALLAAGITASTLSSQGVATAVALMVQIQELINRGDTGETAAQQAFDQYPNRDNYAVDPFRQRYNILGVAQEQVGGFEDISYIQDGFWEGLLKPK